MIAPAPAPAAAPVPVGVSHELRFIAASATNNSPALETFFIVMLGIEPANQSDVALLDYPPDFGRTKTLLTLLSRSKAPVFIFRQSNILLE